VLFCCKYEEEGVEDEGEVTTAAGCNEDSDDDAIGIILLPLGGVVLIGSDMFNGAALLLPESPCCLLFLLESRRLI
jgi:hypothetical protein